jgi:hypothetical protein
MLLIASQNLIKGLFRRPRVAVLRLPNYSSGDAVFCQRYGTHWFNFVGVPLIKISTLSTSIAAAENGMVHIQQRWLILCRYLHFDVVAAMPACLYRVPSSPAAAEHDEKSICYWIGPPLSGVAMVFM